MLDEHKQLVQMTWQDRVRGVERYHIYRCREHEGHTLAQTASELNRSIGRISEDLQIALWMREHPRVEKFKNPRQALDWIKTKRRELKLGEF